MAAGKRPLVSAHCRSATHSITAHYNADSNVNGSTSSAVSQVVNKADTTTSVSSSDNPSTYGQSVTFTATVANVYSCVGADTPTGTVTFYDGANSIGTGTLDASGQTTVSICTLSVTTHSITAHYNVDS